MTTTRPATRNRRRTAAAVAILAAAAAIGSSDMAPAQEAPPPGRNGKTLFVNYGCHQCHGYEGQGGFSGPRIGPTQFSYDAFAGVVRKPYGRMPPYSPAVLSDTELNRIYSYVAAIPPPPPLADIPLLTP